MRSARGSGPPPARWSRPHRGAGVHLEAGGVERPGAYGGAPGRRRVGIDGGGPGCLAGCVGHEELVAGQDDGLDQRQHQQPEERQHQRQLHRRLAAVTAPRCSPGHMAFVRRSTTAWNRPTMAPVLVAQATTPSARPQAARIDEGVLGGALPTLVPASGERGGMGGEGMAGQRDPFGLSGSGKWTGHRLSAPSDPATRGTTVSATNAGKVVSSRGKSKVTGRRRAASSAWRRRRARASMATRSRAGSRGLP